MPIDSRRSTGHDNAARVEGGLVPATRRDEGRPDVLTSRPITETAARPAMHRLTPRQPIIEPRNAATGTPTSRVRDCPLMTQPRARPCWLSVTREEASANITPVNMPLQPPATTDQKATIKNVGAVAMPIRAKIRAKGPKIRNGRRPQRSD